MRTPIPTQIRALGCTPLFAGSSPRQLRRADRFCTVVDVRPAQRLSVAGERPEQLVIIVTGLAAELQPGTTVRPLRPGDCFGALATEHHSCRASPTVIAVTAGVVVAVARHELPGFLEACPSVAERLTRMTIARRSPAEQQCRAATLTSRVLMRSES